MFDDAHTWICDLAIIHLKTTPTELVPAQIAVLTMEERANMTGIRVLGFNGKPQLSDLRKLYPSNISNLELKNGIKAMKPNRLSVTGESPAGLMSLHEKATDDGALKQQRLFLDVVGGNILGYRASTLGGMSGGMVIADGRFIGKL